MAPVPEIAPAEAARKLAEGAVVLDVREDDEWEAGHIAGALHIPLGALTERQSELPAGRPIVAVCRSGSRSAYATAALVHAGYEAANLAGGMQAWAASGLPIEPQDGFVA